MEKILQRLELTEDEAFALLTLAMSSHIELDHTSECAVAKLATYCRQTQSLNHIGLAQQKKLCGAG